MSDAALAVVLGLCSAVTLAFANLAVKMGTDILVGRAILSASAALLILPAAFFVAPPDAATWQALARAIPAHLLYQFCLVQAMQRGDLSLVFPIMRGGAPLLTAIAGVALLGEHLSLAGWAGLVLATGAVALFVRPTGGDSLAQHPDAAAILWALGTAVGVALYNIADAHGVRTAPQPSTYIVWLFLLDWIGVSIAALALRRRALGAAIATKWRYGVTAGALSILSFGAALYAMSLSEAAKVSALRETAVVWAALFGSRFLAEGFGGRRLAAALVLAAGLVLLQIAG